MDHAANNSPPGLEPHLLLELTRTAMPFGRYVGCILADLPEPYLVWFNQRGWPKGRLGQLMATVYEIKANGLEGLLAPLR